MRSRRGSSLTSTEIARRRLEAQRISSTTFTRPEEVVAWLGAVQAQDYLGALWAVGARLTQGRESDVERAIAERAIVRTWPMRGTLHFVAAADARWMTELLMPRAAAAAAGRMRSLGIDDDTAARARRAVEKHLEGGRCLARPAVYRVLESAKVSTEGQRGLHLLWKLAHDGVLCFGPREGKQQTFVLFDEWLPQAKALPREEALAELACRYFTGHGPATHADFAWWSGLTLTDARLSTTLAGERLAEETIDGQRTWLAASAASSPVARAGIYALPSFDELLVGYTDRSAALDASHAGLVTDGGMFYPIIVDDGRVIGTWKRRLARREVVCSTSPFAALKPAKTRAVEAALGRYGRFLGLAMRSEDGASSPKKKSAPRA